MSISDPPMCDEHGHLFKGCTDRLWPYEGQPCLCGKAEWDKANSKARLTAAEEEK